MAKTLLDGFWYDRGADLGSLWEEIETIDRVIIKRIESARRARAAGIVVGSLDAGRLVDDLLWRRQCVMDLIMCLRWEDTFDQADRTLFDWYRAKLSRVRCDRFVG